MYTLLKTWKTSLFHCDCESCFVSYLLPCHVYAKLKQKNYAFHCILYLSLWSMIQLLYSYHYYTYSNACPPSQTDYCILLNESTCEQYYMLVNSVPAKCIFHLDINHCTYDMYSCIFPDEYSKLTIMIFLCSSMLYMFLWWLHYTVRKEIQYRNDLEDPYRCLATSCCSTCGLAQEYREII